MALLLGYTLTGMSTLCGLWIFGQMLLGEIGIHVPILRCLLLASCFVRYRPQGHSALREDDARFEGISLVAILALAIIVWTFKGFALDWSQLSLKAQLQAGC